MTGYEVGFLLFLELGVINPFMDEDLDDRL
jgi:hypothetical protein